MSGIAFSSGISLPRFSTGRLLLAIACFVGMADRGIGQIIVLDVPSPLEGNQNNFDGELGMDFDVVSFDIEVTALGIFDSLQDGILGADTSIHVELWERNNNGTPDIPGDDTGVSVLASHIFTMGDDGVLMGGSRFKDIPSLTLPPGSYSIAAGGFFGVDPNWNWGSSAAPEVEGATINDSGGNLVFKSAKWGTAFAPGNYPSNVDGAPPNRYHAGNFIYERTVELDTALKLQVDRDNGELTLVNNSASDATLLSYAIRSANGSLDPSAWKSIADFFDADAPSPGTGSIDPDDTWVKLTNPANRTDLSELEVGGTGPGNGAILSQGASIHLGANAWIKSPTEDLTFTYLLSDGSVVEGLVDYVGSTQMGTYRVGDLNFDGTPYALDDFTAVMLPMLVSDLPATLSTAEAYQSGDLNDDRRVDQLDFRLFKQGYLAQGGSLASLNATPVPEPATWIATLLLGVIGMSFVRKLNNKMIGTARASLILAAIGLWAAFGSTRQVKAQIIALEVPAPLTGTQDDFDGELGMDFVVTEFPIEVSSLGFFDSMQDGIVGTENSIHVEIWRRNDGGTPDDPIDDSGISVVTSTAFTFGDDGTLIGGSRFRNVGSVTLSPGAYTIVAGGFWEEDSIWNAGGGRAEDISTINGSGGIVRFVGSSRFGTAFAPNNFPGTPDGGPANRYHAGNFSYTPIVEPLVLEVNVATGLASILNEGGDTFDIDTYEILSDESGPGSLDDSWSGLGGAWLKGGASNAYSLSEFNLGSSLEIEPGGMQSLGGVFNTSAGAQDLTFIYTTGGGVELEGVVRYVTGVADADFNGDSMVNLADYVVWRDSLGATGVTPFDRGDANGDGNVTGNDYSLWKSHFGSSGGAGAETAPVPEPSAAALLALAVAGVLAMGLRRCAPIERRTLAQVSVRMAFALAACLALSQVCQADVRNDRLYLFGDDTSEDAANAGGSVVGSGPNNANPGKTLDSAGTSGAYDDLNQNGDPLYVDVGPGGLGRPGAASGNLGIRFQGGDDRLFTDQVNAFALNRPDEFAGPTPVGPDTPIAPNYPYNYDDITARGLQMWVYPDASAVGTARQGVVFDTVAAGGIAITADGNWTQVNDGHFLDISFPGVMEVEGDQWSHVMHHIYRSGDSGIPALVPGTGTDLGFTSVLYVNGIAVSANNDTPAPGDMLSGLRTGALVVGAEEISGDGVVAAFDNPFHGVLDDLEMYVYGDNSELAGPPAGDNYGQFDLFADNKWIADKIASTVPGRSLKLGDINLDGNVDGLDVDAFVDGWLRQKTLIGAHNQMTVGDWETWGWGDLDHDGFVFMKDAYLLHEALLANGQGGLGLFGFPGGEVPEPSSCVLALLLLASSARWFRSRAAAK